MLLAKDYLHVGNSQIYSSPDLNPELQVHISNSLLGISHWHLKLDLSKMYLLVLSSLSLPNLQLVLTLAISNNNWHWLI